MNWWMCQSKFQAAEKMNEVIAVSFFFEKNNIYGQSRANGTPRPNGNFDNALCIFTPASFQILHEMTVISN